MPNTNMCSRARSIHCRINCADGMIVDNFIRNVGFASYWERHLAHTDQRTQNVRSFLLPLKQNHPSKRPLSQSQISVWYIWSTLRQTFLFDLGLNARQRQHMHINMRTSEWHADIQPSIRYIHHIFFRTILCVLHHRTAHMSIYILWCLVPFAHLFRSHVVSVCATPMCLVYCVYDVCVCMSRTLLSHRLCVWAASGGYEHTRAQYY